MTGEGLDIKEMGPNGLGFRVVNIAKVEVIKNKGYAGTEKVTRIEKTLHGTALPLSEAEQMRDKLNEGRSWKDKLLGRGAKVVEDRPNLQK